MDFITFIVENDLDIFVFEIAMGDWVAKTMI